MIDLYLIITPLAGLLAFMTVVNLKMTLNEPKTSDLQKYQKKQQKIIDNHQIQPNPVKQSVKDQTLQPGFKKTLLFLLKNCTLLDFFTTKRSRNKIPLILSTCIVAILSVTINLPIAFCFINTIVTLTFLFGKILTQNEEQQNTTVYPQNLNETKQKVKKQEKLQQKLEIILSSLSLLANIIFIGLVYKNYRNQFLISAVQNFLITCAVDNFLVKPVVLTISGFFIKNVMFVDQFIDKEIQIIEIIQGQRVLKRVAEINISSLSPKKMVSSPSKVPKAIRVEPRITLQSTDQYISTLQLANSLKKPKLSPIVLKRPQNQNVEGDCSLISIMNSHQKKLNSNQNRSFDFDKQLFQQKVQQNQQPIPQVEFDTRPQQQDEIKETNLNEEDNKTKMLNSKLMMISQDHSIIDNFDNCQIDNQQEEDINNNNKSILKSLKDSGDFKTILSHKQNDNLKISLQRSIYDNHQDKQNFEQFFQVDHYHHQLRPHSTLEQDNSILGYGSALGTARRDGLLKINQDGKAEDLQQIDLNSPQRRKQQLSKIVQDSQIPQKKKKNYKKYSLDPNRHVIKHSTGEPYLQFLPNLLKKQRQQKKKKASHQVSQHTFSRKIDLLNGMVNQSRVSKSVKRPKNTRDYIMKENDQNKVPQFMIEDFN